MAHTTSTRRDGKPILEELLIALFESQQQAQHDFCGEQREWHLPRLNKVAIGMMAMFPADAAAALMKAKTPYDAVEPPTPKE